MVKSSFQFYNSMLVEILGEGRPDNSRCCCNETASTTGRKLAYFLPALHRGISLLVFKKIL